MNIFIALIISVGIGWFLRKLISPKLTSRTAIDYGRAWAGWTVLGSCGAVMSRWLLIPDIEHFMGFLAAITTWPIVAFILGWSIWKIKEMRSGDPEPPLSEASKPEAVTRGEGNTLDLNNHADSTPNTLLDDLLYESALYTDHQYVVDENKIYSLIAEELESTRIDKGLWIRLFAESNGDEKQTEVLYIRQRASHLIAEEQLRIKKLADKQAAEAEAAAKLEAEEKRERIKDEYQKQQVKNREKEINLLNRARSNDVDEVLELLKNDPLLIAATDSTGDTALHIAIRERNLKLPELLIQYGADLDAKNKYGITPRELAEDNKKKERNENIAIIFIFSALMLFCASFLFQNK